MLIGSGATVDGTGGSVTLSGGAIDGRGAIFRDAGFSADVVNPPAAGVAQRNDNGQLTAPCLEGDICLGAIAATGAVRIGQGNSAPVRFTRTGPISGSGVAITSRNTLTYGAAASPFTLQFAGITAAGDVALTATTTSGGDVTSTAGAIRLAATGAATLGQFRAATDVTAQATTLAFAGITAGRNVTLDVTTLGGTAINAGQDLTIRSVNDLTFGTIAAGRNLSLSATSGAITVNTDIDAGGTVSLLGDAILVKAVGPLTVARVTADNGDIAIVTDGLLQVANAAARGDVALTSTANSLILGPVVAGRALATPLALNPSGTSKGTPDPARSR